MTENHQFIVTHFDAHTIDLEPYQFSGTNITIVRLVDPENPILADYAKYLAKSKMRREGENEEEPENDFSVAERDDEAENEEGDENQAETGDEEKEEEDAEETEGNENLVDDEAEGN